MRRGIHLRLSSGALPFGESKEGMWWVRECSKNHAWRATIVNKVQGRCLKE